MAITTNTTNLQSDVQCFILKWRSDDSVILRYYIPENHDVFVYLIDGNDFILSGLWCLSLSFIQSSIRTLLVLMLS